MTESRENVRRRQFRDRTVEFQQAATPLSRLCIIQGCLNLRVGTNLCPAHDAQSTRTQAVSLPTTTATRGWVRPPIAPTTTKSDA